MRILGFGVLSILAVFSVTNSVAFAATPQASVRANWKLASFIVEGHGSSLECDKISLEPGQNSESALSAILTNDANPCIARRADVMKMKIMMAGEGRNTRPTDIVISRFDVRSGVNISSMVNPATELPQLIEEKKRFGHELILIPTTAFDREAVALFGREMASESYFITSCRTFVSEFQEFMGVQNPFRERTMRCLGSDREGQRIQLEFNDTNY